MSVTKRFLPSEAHSSESAELPALSSDVRISGSPPFSLRTWTRRQFARTSLAFLGSQAVSRLECALAADSSLVSQTIPPDLPLPRSEPSEARWLRQAVILQPWAKTQYAALVGVDRPRRLREEFGFNAIIVLPTEAHNALLDFLAAPDFHLTDAQFRNGIDAYRKEGYRLILYSSVMHCGHAPDWQNGELGRDHPEWSQRDALGNAITSFGHAAWLCGSTPAREYTLNYTLRLVQEYSPDGIMLDNNGFGHTANGWTCYCEFCQQGFRKYVLTRCGEDWIKSELHIQPHELKIPTTPGPLFALWTQWRNRVWAEINELFRLRLRTINPEILLFANTQYDLPVNTQANSLELQHEDVVFSETHETDSWYISQKMVFGQALAPGLPLWDYMGTFAETPEGVALDRLRPPELLRRIIPASLAHGARPWIVYFGFEDSESRIGLREIARHLSWLLSHRGLFAGTPNTPVATIVSLRARDLLARVGKCIGQGVTGCYPESPTPLALIPPHMVSLLKAGVPVVALRETHLSPATLNPFQIVTLETDAIMTGKEVLALVNWVRTGGFLITRPNACEYDELGRKPVRPLLPETLRLNRDLRELQKCGKGKVLIVEPERFADATLAAVRSCDVPFTLPSGIEVVCYRSPSCHIIHLLRHDAGSGPFSLRFPRWLGARAGQAAWCSPSWADSKMLEIKQDGSSLGLRFPELPEYSVITTSRDHSARTKGFAIS